MLRFGNGTIPSVSRLHDDNLLVKVFGLDAARKICERLIGHIQVPYGPTSIRFKSHALMRQLVLEGMSAALIASRVGVHYRTVLRMRKDMLAAGDPVPATPAVIREGTVIPSDTEEENYGWLGGNQRMREWIGDRVVNSLVLHGYAIKNKLFEMTHSVPRVKIEDDKYGVFAPMFEQMGHAAVLYPDENVFALLPNGFTTNCYDGKPFFSAGHVSEFSDNGIAQSNLLDGEEPAWYLLDCSRPIKPLVFQERLKPSFIHFTAETNENVFWRDEYIYGARARSNAGYGLWQLAFAAKVPLTSANFESAFQAMASQKDEAGKPLGIMPNKLVVGASQIGAAKRLMNGQRIEVIGGHPVAIANEWAGTVDIIVSPWL